MPALQIDRPLPEVTMLTLTRPASLNALNAELMSELYEAFADIARDPGIRAVIITGAGKAFCAGLDIRDFGGPVPTANDGDAALLAFQESMSSIVSVVRELPQPVIAAVNGAAVGGGMALACASDIRLATAQARFGTGAIRIGLSGCEMGLSYHLPRLVGLGVAAEWMLTGRMVGGAEALAAGLISRIVDTDRLVDDAIETASLIAGNSPHGVRMTKQLIWTSADASSLREAMQREDATQVAAWQTEDAAEARAALLDKRAPRFRNR